MPTGKKPPVRDSMPAKSLPPPAAVDGEAPKQQQQARKIDKKRDDHDLLAINPVDRETHHLDGRLSAVPEDPSILRAHDPKVRAPAVMPPTTARECPVHSRPRPTPAPLSDTDPDSDHSATWSAADDARQLATLHHYLTDIATLPLRERAHLEATLRARSLRRSPHPAFPRTRAYFLTWLVTTQPHLSLSAPRHAYAFLCTHVFRCRPLPATIYGPAIDARRDWCFRRDGQEGRRVRGARLEGFWGVGGTGEDLEVVVLSLGGWDWKGERLGFAFLRAWFGGSARRRMERLVRGSGEASKDEGGGEDEVVA